MEREKNEPLWKKIFYGATDVATLGLLIAASITISKIDWEKVEKLFQSTENVKEKIEKVTNIPLTEDQALQKLFQEGNISKQDSLFLESFALKKARRRGKWIHSKKSLDEHFEYINKKNEQYKKSIERINPKDTNQDAIEIRSHFVRELIKNILIKRNLEKDTTLLK